MARNTRPTFAPDFVRQIRHATHEFYSQYHRSVPGTTAYVDILRRNRAYFMRAADRRVPDSRAALNRMWRVMHRASVLHVQAGGHLVPMPPMAYPDVPGLGCDRCDGRLGCCHGLDGWFDSLLEWLGVPQRTTSSMPVVVDESTVAVGGAETSGERRGKERRRRRDGRVEQRRSARRERQRGTPVVSASGEVIGMSLPVEQRRESVASRAARRALRSSLGGARAFRQAEIDLLTQGSEVPDEGDALAWLRDHEPSPQREQAMRRAYVDAMAAFRRAGGQPGLGCCGLGYAGNPANMPLIIPDYRGGSFVSSSAVPYTQAVIGSPARVAGAIAQIRGEDDAGYGYLPRDPRRRREARKYMQHAAQMLWNPTLPAGERQQLMDQLRAGGAPIGTTGDSVARALSFGPAAIGAPVGLVGTRRR